MSKVTFATLVGVAAAGGKLALTWEDCGDSSTHGHTDDVQPTEINIGDDTTITGTGTTDKQIDSGSFTMKLTASLGIKETYEGKICEPKTFNMPLGLGTVSWGGMECPVPVGASSVSLGVKMASSVPAALAKADLALTATDQDGEQALCVNTHLKKESTFDASVEASCSGTDDFPSTPVCYGSNVMGQEDVVLKIESFASGAGRLSMTGTGATPLGCETAFTKDAKNKITFDDCDVSSYATVKGAQYCSDSDELKATFNPLGVPIPVSVKFPKMDCASLGAKSSGIDCSTAACPDQCQCGLDKCGSQIDTCLADASCAKGQDCAMACPCSDTACELKCAATNPSVKALPVATCLNSNCASSAVNV